MDKRVKKVKAINAYCISYEDEGWTLTVARTHRTRKQARCWADERRVHTIIPVEIIPVPPKKARRK